MSNPMEYDWFMSEQRDDGGIDVYAGWGGSASENAFADRKDGGNHGHFGVDLVGEDFGRSGPRGTPNDY